MEEQSTAAEQETGDEESTDEEEDGGSGATAEQQTVRSIVVREVTAIQASWTETERGEEGAFTLQLILDHGAEEYVLQPDSDDLDVLLQLFKRSPHVSFDLERKVLMFGNLATAPA